MPFSSLSLRGSSVLLRAGFLALLLIGFAGCRIERVDDGDAADNPGVTSAGGYERFTEDELERDRYSGRFRAVARVDTAAAGAAARANRERLDDLNAARLDTARITLPLGGKVEGPSVLRAQILLDRAGFSPGQIDGRWGDNTENAVYWFQQASSLNATGVVDSATYRALESEAGSPAQFVTTYRITENDAQYPYRSIPSDIYQKAELDSLVYESMAEKLGEQFHASPDLLGRLNTGRDLNTLAAGDTIRVPNVQGGRTKGGQVAQVVISGQGQYLHAQDASGRVLYHFPATLGTSYDPSPQGQFSVESVTRYPWWHYQPELLADVPDSEEDARIPPGPNNAVGKVWMALSEPHYGIHGTSAPQTIGYASSAGCVRLTNWDALFLADRVSTGTSVVFRDVAGRTASGARAGAPDAAGRADTVRSR